MSTTVYIWRSSPRHPIGHTAMDVNGVYMSYWPATAAGKKDFKLGTQHGVVFSERYALDRRIEKREADSRITLIRLNELTMIEAWRGIIANPPNYNMVKQNCSTTIAGVLEVGSGVVPSFQPKLDVGREVPSNAHRLMLRLRYFTSQIEMWTPDALYRYVMEIQRGETPR
jgi:hypothetical protein